jgi:ligand-binding sensor domain-containing protein
MWFGTNRGLSRYDSKTFSKFDVMSGLPGNDVYAIAPAGAGEVWVGTRDGVARLAPKQPEE